MDTAPVPHAPVHTACRSQRFAVEGAAGPRSIRAPSRLGGRPRASTRRIQGCTGAGRDALGRKRPLGQETDHWGRAAVHWGGKRAIGAGNPPGPMNGFLPRCGPLCARTRIRCAPSSAFTATPHSASAITLAKWRHPFKYSASLAELPAQPRPVHFPRRTSSTQTPATARGPGPALPLPARDPPGPLAAASADREPVPQCSPPRTPPPLPAEDRSAPARAGGSSATGRDPSPRGITRRDRRSPAPPRRVRSDAHLPC